MIAAAAVASVALFAINGGRLLFALSFDRRAGRTPE